MEAVRETESLFISEAEPYMNDRQLAYFKNKLICQKMTLMEKVSQNKNKIKMMGSAQPDIIDKTNILVEVEKDIRSHERRTQLIREIDQALERIEDGSFGYCQATGDQIGLRRLDAMPAATLSIQAIEEIEASLNRQYTH